jgi:hypothetical protein
MAVKFYVLLAYLSLQENKRAKCEVIIAVLIKIQAFCNMTPCMLVNTDVCEVTKHYFPLLTSYLAVGWIK